MVSTAVGQREKGRKRPTLCRPVLEALEDRLLLSSAATAGVQVESVAATGSIRGTIFNDRDGNGLISRGDAGLGGRTVFLDLNHDGILDGHDPSTQTAADGSFVFSHVAPGTYTVCQVLPGGWVPSSYRMIAGAGPTSPADQLIQLDRFRADPNFAGIYGQGESVVVIDSGIDAGNAAFGPEVNGAGDAIVYQHNYLTGSTSALDGDGHGTFVASIIASRNPAYLGIAPGVNLIDLKVLDNKGNGEFSDIDSALRWVLANAQKYHIVCVNMSFGDGGNWTKQESLYGIGGDLAALAAHDVTVVAAAGNDYHGGTPMPGLSYPADDPDVISVGAVWDANDGGPWLWSNNVRDNSTGPDQIMGFSQRLPGSGEVFAPGSMLTGAAVGGGTTTMSGTSVAAAVVSGLVALAQQLAVEKLGHPLSVAQIRILLNTTGVAIHDSQNGQDNVGHTGAVFHRVNAYALGESILAMGSKTTAIPPGSQVVSVGKGATVAGVYLGAFQLARVSGIVFGDNNANGSLDPGETGLAGQLVFADTNGDGKFEKGEPFTYTNGQGQYTLAGLGPGVVDICVQPQGGKQVTKPPVKLSITSGLNRTGIDDGIATKSAIHTSL
jgi:subtilisin family serine protease